MTGNRIRAVLAPLAVLAVLVVLSVGAPLRAAAQERGPASDIVDVPVSFEVQNVNRSVNQCRTDGRTYTVRGFLTAPAALLAGPTPPVTLYVHGTNTAQWIWRLNVDGFNYVQELAERGHASVTIDRLGYGSNPVPDGFDTCTGANADVAHQVVDHLRNGTYTVQGRAPTSFGRVYLGGHSSGALVAELVAASFGNIDGIIATGWAGIGITSETARRFFPMFDTCQRELADGPAPAGSGEVNGYAFFDQTLADFYQASISSHADPRVVQAMAGFHVPSPCGVMLSEPMAIMEDLTSLGDVRVPVLFVFGADDTLRQGVGPYPGLFSGSPDVTAMTVPGAGHIMLVDTNSVMVYDAVAEWLDRRR